METQNEVPTIIETRNEVPTTIGTPNDAPITIEIPNEAPKDDTSMDTDLANFLKNDIGVPTDIHMDVYFLYILHRYTCRVLA